MGTFDRFIVLAEMRTGSNLLEARINLFDDLECFGEVFNPYFVHDPEDHSKLHQLLAAREHGQSAAVDKMAELAQGKIHGFRWFNGHDLEVLDQALNDPKCAKIVLDRNPLDSFISYQIARQTDHWLQRERRINTVEPERITVDVDALEGFLEQRQVMRNLIRNQLQITGQTGFYIHFDDLSDRNVINGLGKFLGSTHEIRHIRGAVGRQNPKSLDEKITNRTELETKLKTLDLIGNDMRVPMVQPIWTASRQVVVAKKAPIAYFPPSRRDQDPILTWLDENGGYETDLSMRELHQRYQRQTGWHRLFCAEPAINRALWAFDDLMTGKEQHPRLLNRLEKFYNVSVPQGDGPAGEHITKENLLCFLRYLNNSVEGQSKVTVRRNWAAQKAWLASYGRYGQTDYILSPDRTKPILTSIAGMLGFTPPKNLTWEMPGSLQGFTQDEEIQAAVHTAYNADFERFGLSA